MTEPGTRAGDRAQEPAPPGARRRRAGAGVLAAGAFVAGLLAGAIALALLMDSPPAGLAGGAGGAVATPTSTPADPDPGAAAGVRVNDACLRVVDAAQDSLGAIEDVGRAAADLDLGRLGEVVRGLEPLQDRLRDDLADCRVDGELPEDLRRSGEGADPGGD